MYISQHLHHSASFAIKLHPSPFTLATHARLRFWVWSTPSTVPEEDEWCRDFALERLAKCHSVRLLLSCASLHPCRILMMPGKGCKHVIAIMFMLPAGSAWPPRPVFFQSGIFRWRLASHSVAQTWAKWHRDMAFSETGTLISHCDSVDNESVKYLEYLDLEWQKRFSQAHAVTYYLRLLIPGNKSELYLCFVYLGHVL